jgi:hypothetical protein
MVRADIGKCRASRKRMLAEGLPHSTGTGRQVVAGLLRVSSCSTVPGGAKCNGRHAELVNKIRGP